MTEATSTESPSTDAETASENESPKEDESPKGDIAPKKPTREAPPMLLRIGLGIVGLGLFIGFFLPWVHLGDVVSLSGLGLAIAGGDAANEMSGPNRALILIVPVAGILLFAGAIRGTRGLAWAGMAAGFSIFMVGLYTLIRVFLDSTGAGMWFVTGSAVGGILIGLVYSRVRIRRE